VSVCTVMTSLFHSAEELLLPLATVMDPVLLGVTFGGIHSLIARAGYPSSILRPLTFGVLSSLHGSQNSQACEHGSANQIYSWKADWEGDKQARKLSAGFPVSGYLLEIGAGDIVVARNILSGAVQPYFLAQRDYALGWILPPPYPNSYIEALTPRTLKC
jgi:hypothetical protein